ncbi:hypothetical protein DFP72DRAFT_1175150 [Ephemerocybe angulata]|uniref:Uncharacterized protein n=1 Tax=Ephemerocybe angulata TaxID=980116 RepID=A0A8H6HHJ6_9AGAR|nr:hypothetical protein DFP72DRAFT_1175150 [Tulosesus angulatus]
MRRRSWSIRWVLDSDRGKEDKRWNSPRVYPSSPSPFPSPLSFLSRPLLQLLSLHNAPLMAYYPSSSSSSSLSSLTASSPVPAPRPSGQGSDASTSKAAAASTSKGDLLLLHLQGNVLCPVCLDCPSSPFASPNFSFPFFPHPPLSSVVNVPRSSPSTPHMVDTACSVARSSSTTKKATKLATVGFWPVREASSLGGVRINVNLSTKRRGLHHRPLVRRHHLFPSPLPSLAHMFRRRFASIVHAHHYPRLLCRRRLGDIGLRARISSREIQTAVRLILPDASGAWLGRPGGYLTLSTSINKDAVVRSSIATSSLSRLSPSSSTRALIVLPGCAGAVAIDVGDLCAGQLVDWLSSVSRGLPTPIWHRTRGTDAGCGSAGSVGKGK